MSQPSSDITPVLHDLESTSIEALEHTRDGARDLHGPHSVSGTNLRFGLIFDLSSDLAQRRRAAGKNTSNSVRAEPGMTPSQRGSEPRLGRIDLHNVRALIASRVKDTRAPKTDVRQAVSVEFILPIHTRNGSPIVVGAFDTIVTEALLLQGQLRLFPGGTLRICDGVLTFDHALFLNFQTRAVTQLPALKRRTSELLEQDESAFVPSYGGDFLQSLGLGGQARTKASRPR